MKINLANFIFVFCMYNTRSMSTQIFKSAVPNEILFSLFEKICVKTDKYYIFDNCAYKRGNLLDAYPSFLQECIPYYHLSKRKYLEKKIAYNNLTTVFRQICNFNQIGFTSKIKYDKGAYNIVYFFYF